MANSDILLKVIALYLLDRAKGALSNAHICEFFVSGNYTDYFSTLALINELSENGLINTNESHNTTSYDITDSGKETLLALKDKVGPTVREEIDNFLKQNEIAFRKTRELKSYYDKSSYGGYIVTLKALDENKPIIDINFHVGSEILAKSICTNWKNNYEKVYEAIMDLA